MAHRSQFLHSWALGLAVAILAGDGLIAHGAEQPEQPAGAVGLRQIKSKHLTLYTDLPANPDIDALPGIVDQAFGQWCAYFGVDAQQHADWHLRAYLMKAREHFKSAGVLPGDLPEFLNGYSRGDQIWLHDQTSPYYRRHLLLHEATHVFMNSLGHGMGPPWYSEGMAELMATHRLEDGRLTLDYLPANRGEVPKWGRIEIVQKGYAERRAMTLDKILQYPNRAFLDTEPYGWCWAATTFFDGHPRYQARFRQLHLLAAEEDFNAKLRGAFADDWDRVNEDWQLFVANLDYGYDFARMDVTLAAGQPLRENGAKATVAADRSWQSTGVQLEAGKTYRLRATGRCKIASEPRVWWSEPGGVTIHYYHGQPLGILLAAIRSDEANPKAVNGLLKPLVVGLESTITPQRSGTLYLRINDSSGSLADNAGSFDVEITRD